MSTEKFRTLILPAALVLTLLLAATANASPEWNPDIWAEEETLELMTQAPDDEPYWFPVWLVVIEDELYVRLGTHAADRVNESVTNPYVGLRVGGEEFARVKTIMAPEESAAVDHEMGEKYWSDFYIRLMPHPMTLRLVPVE